MQGIIIATLLCGLLSPSSYALGLLEIYTLAQKNDPEFLAASEERMAGEEYRHMGRAALLPSVSLSWQNGMKNWQRAKTQQRQSIYSNKTHDVTTHAQYSSQNGSMTLTQPLFDYEAWSRYQSGKAQSLMSEEVWRSRAMELATRVVNRYLDVLAAQDKVRLTTEQYASYQQLLTQNQKMLRAGEGTITEVVETESHLSLAEAEKIAADEELLAARREISQLTGQPEVSMPPLNRLMEKHLKPLRLNPARFSEWKKIALSQNADLAAARYQLKVNYHQQEQQRASFLPRIQVYASHGINKSASDTTINQRYETSSVGVQVNYSLYAGGYNSAALRQTKYNYNKSKYDLEKSTRETMNNLHKFFQQHSSAERRLSAYQQAVNSARQQIDATQKGIHAGQRTNADLINAQRQFYQAQLDMAQEKYRYIHSWLMLHYHSGNLTPEKLITISNLFSPWK
ncbi:TolC family outer membrane protein [Jejubacter calystegiae]|uniref:TolC family outer membrane protein n=1 Tax=Jejubacter calystegiae TaxID=2579935 RepID=A0A4P8YHK1_9ENTR|nr:TolC family outer membrane protein [Jejubacter calystegiae]QCT19306.1 TolC family outer membrane protein [Jejubacter calystegiae]